jgi:hypothetical protein
VLFAVLTALFILGAMKEAFTETKRQLADKKQIVTTTSEILKPVANNKLKAQSLTPKERQELSQEFNQNQSPFIAGPPVRYGNFFGREEIIQSLFNLWRGFPMQNAAIYDEKRIGKTSLLRYLKDVVDNPDDSQFREGQKTDWLPNSGLYCFIYVDFQDNEYQTPKGLLEYILQNMKLEKANGLDLSVVLNKVVIVKLILTLSG